MTAWCGHDAPHRLLQARRRALAPLSNTASGVTALYLNTTGSSNVATAVGALQDNTTGNNNTAIGFKASRKSLGTKNMAMGYQAGVTMTTGNNNIYIGNSGNGDESQTIRIGTAQAQTFIAASAPRRSAARS